MYGKKINGWKTMSANPTEENCKLVKITCEGRAHKKNQLPAWRGRSGSVKAEKKVKNSLEKKLTFFRFGGETPKSISMSKSMEQAKWPDTCLRFRKKTKGKFFSKKKIILDF